MKRSERNRLVVVREAGVFQDFLEIRLISGKGFELFFNAYGPEVAEHLDQFLPTDYLERITEDQLGHVPEGGVTIQELPPVDTTAMNRRERLVAISARIILAQLYNMLITNQSASR